MPSPDHIFDPWQPGDAIAARRLNELQAVVQEHGRALITSEKSSVTTRWVRLTQWIGPESNFTDRSGVEQYLNPDTGEWGDIPGGRTLTKICDPTKSQCYPEGLIVPCRMHWSGKAVPEVPGVQTLEGKLDEDLLPGDTATMSIYVFDPASEDYVDTGVNVEASAPASLTSGTVEEDTWVTAHWLPPHGASFPARWVVQGVADVRVPRKFKGTLDSECEATDATTSVTVTLAFDGGDLPDPDEVSVRNELHKGGDAGDIVYIEEDLSTDPVTYILLDVEHYACEEIEG